MATKWKATKDKLSRQILDAALVEFAEHGYSKTTIKKIADRAKSSTGVINKYFESKENLFYTILAQESLSNAFIGKEKLEKEMPSAFFMYLDWVREAQKSKPLFFKMWVNITNSTDIPENCRERMKKDFYESPLYIAIVDTQKKGELPKSDPFKLFLMFSMNAMDILNTCDTLKIEPPDYDTFLSIINYQPEESYQHKLFDAMNGDRILLFTALKSIYTMSISCNLTDNTYHSIDYDIYASNEFAHTGNYDNLMKVVSEGITDVEARNEFIRLFDRKNLIRAFEKGERQRTMVHEILRDSGRRLIVETTCFLAESSKKKIYSMHLVKTIKVL